MLSAKRDDLVKRNIVDVWQQNFKVIEHGICTRWGTNSALTLRHDQRIGIDPHGPCR